VLLVGALAMIAWLFVQLTRTQDDLAALQTEVDMASGEMARVEAGAALFASQVTGLQDSIVSLEPQVSTGLDAAIVGLNEFGSSTVTFDVSIDETIPVSTEVVIDRVVKVPIVTTIPIKETFDTTIEVDTPLGFSVPVDVTVPVDVDVPLDLEVEIPVKETIPIEEEFAVDLDVPIQIDIADTELADLSNSLADGLESFRTGLDGIG